MLKVDVKVPKLDLRIKSKAVLQKAGTKAAALIRKRLRAGVDSHGGAIPAAKDKEAKKPLRRTGSLIKSIKRGRVKTSSAVDGDSVSVGPKGKRADGKSQLSVAASLQKRGIFMELTPDEEAEVAKAIEAEIEKQLSKL